MPAPRRLALLLVPLLLLALLPPPASAASASEGYVGFDIGFTNAIAQKQVIGCDVDVNLGNACFSVSVNGGRTLSATVRVRDATGAIVPFGIVIWYGDGTGISDLVLYCGDATLSHRAPSSGIEAVSVVVWGGHPVGLLCPVVSGSAYVPGLPGTATVTT